MALATDSSFISTDLAPIKKSSVCHPQCNQPPGSQMNSQPSLDRRGPRDQEKAAESKGIWAMPMPSLVCQQVLKASDISGIGVVLSPMCKDEDISSIHRQQSAQPWNARGLESPQKTSPLWSAALGHQSLWSSLFRGSHGVDHQQQTSLSQSALPTMVGFEQQAPANFKGDYPAVCTGDFIDVGFLYPCK